MRQPLSFFASSVRVRLDQSNGGDSVGAASSAGHDYGFLHWLNEDDQQLQPGFYLMRLRQKHVRSRRHWGYRSSSLAAAHA